MPPPPPSTLFPFSLLWFDKLLGKKWAQKKRETQSGDVIYDENESAQGQNTTTEIRQSQQREAVKTRFQNHNGDKLRKR